jgi:hypothetical protein
MSDIPDGIVLRRHRDLVGRGWTVWFRRVMLALLALIPLLALLNAFGQEPTASVASSAAARLEVSSPSRARGGLLYTSRFRVEARREIDNAWLVLSSGWLEGITVNTIEPSPLDEGSDDGRLALHLGRIPAGESYVLWMDFQVNPTNVGHRSQDVVLRDGESPLLEVRRSITVFP